MDSFAIEPPVVVLEPSERMKHLTERTRICNVENNIPIRRYWRAAPQILQMANTYQDEENYEKAFLLYMKYITLFIEKLPTHPEYPTIEPEKKSKVKNNIKTLLNIVQLIKEKILKKYREEYQDYLERKKEYDLAVQEQNSRLNELKKNNIENEKAKLQNDFVKKLQNEIDKKKKELAKKDVADVKLPDEPDVEPDESSGESAKDTAPDPDLVSDYSKRPIIDRSKKPSLSILEDADADFFRQLIVPFKAISEKFSRIAQSNTDKNIETCGILCGQLKRNRFTITHILVPKQNGTSDSCTSLNEEEMAMEQEKHQLITLGWIHTHPSQRSFLSSIDLHTHALYQKMLPEAIAIVVAPSTDEICMYSLTDYGLDYILKCRETGFHPHANEERIYQQTEHTVVDDKLSVQVIDLR